MDCSKNSELNEALQRMKDRHIAEEAAESFEQERAVEASCEAIEKRLKELRSINKMHDAVECPEHYTDHPSGVECITITEWMSFNVGNAMKYLWRAGKKTDELEDLKKARWYVNREIRRLEKLNDA